MVKKVVVDARAVRTGVELLSGHCQRSSDANVENAEDQVFAPNHLEHHLTRVFDFGWRTSCLTVEGRMVYPNRINVGRLPD